MSRKTRTQLLTADGTLGLPLELKNVSVEQRIIEGHAAATRNTDRNGDVIEPGAFTDAVAAGPDSAAVFIAHDLQTIPVGEPVEMREDAKGLATTTRIYKTTTGDDLLEWARDRMSNGKPIGMSIGYRVPAGGAKFEEIRQGGRVVGMVRKITKLELKEYSYAAHQIIANPRALVDGVKIEDLADDEDDHGLVGVARDVHSIGTKVANLGEAIAEYQAAAELLNLDAKSVIQLAPDTRAALAEAVEELKRVLEGTDTPEPEPAGPDRETIEASMRFWKSRLAAAAAD